MTATERCAFLRFQFPSAGVARVLVEMSRPGVSGFAAVNPKTHEITGYNPHRMDSHLGPFKLPNFKRLLRRSVRAAPQNTGPTAWKTRTRRRAVEHSPSFARVNSWKSASAHRS